MLLKSEIENAYFLQQEKIKQNKSNVIRKKAASIAIDNSFVQVISGIRRCGKSTLLRFLMEKYAKIAYFNFEDPRILNFEVSDFSKLEEIIPKNVEAYFFDEIQNVAQWEIYIRQLHDYEKKIFITGSNASLLSKDLGTRLTGRYLNTELFPFSYQEFLVFEKKEANLLSLTNYLNKGGFPEYLKSNNVEILQNLFKDIVFRDIAIRYGIRNTKTLIDIALFLISNVGKETTYTSLKKTFQVGSTNTVVDYLTWLEDAYLLFFLQKFSYSAKSIAVNPRKVYAIDNGLINANSLSFCSDNGRKLENAVYIYLRNKGAKMYYFREKNECDFVLFDKDKCTAALQVCYEINGDNKTRELGGLIEAMQFFDLKEGFIITQNQKDSLQIEDKTVCLIPAFEYFMKS
jgi:predicted AAA+ superfamily ATPase